MLMSGPCPAQPSRCGPELEIHPAGEEIKDSPCQWAAGHVEQGGWPTEGGLKAKVARLGPRWGLGACYHDLRKSF